MLRNAIENGVHATLVPVWNYIQRIIFFAEYNSPNKAISGENGQRTQWPLQYPVSIDPFNVLLHVESETGYSKEIS